MTASVSYRCLHAWWTHAPEPEYTEVIVQASTCPACREYYEWYLPECRAWRVSPKSVQRWFRERGTR